MRRLTRCAISPLDNFAPLPPATCLTSSERQSHPARAVALSEAVATMRGMYERTFAR